MGQHTVQGDGSRRRRRWALHVLGVLATLAWVGTTTPALAAGAPSTTIRAVDVSRSKAPSCQNCETFLLQMPPAGPTNSSFGDQPNTTVDVEAVIPADWHHVECGDDFGVVARDQSDLAVPEWHCQAGDHRLRFFGPGAKDPETAAVGFLFRAEQPNPAMTLAEPFIDVVQTYLDGEQRALRGAKYLRVARPAPSSLVLHIGLPADWQSSDCPGPAKAAKADNSPVLGWTCTPTIGVGPHPPVDLEWMGGAAAKFYYFHAFTPALLPALTPLKKGINDLTDLMFVDGQIPLQFIANLRTGHPYIKPSPVPHPTVTPTPTPGVDSTCQANVTNQGGGSGGSGGYGGGYGGYGGGYGGYGGGYPGGYGGYGGYGNGVNGINGINGQTALSSECTPPQILIDPCFGAAFTQYGFGRFAPPLWRNRHLPATCSGHAGYWPQHPRYGHVDETVVEPDDSSCIHRAGPPPPAVRPTDPPRQDPPAVKPQRYDDHVHEHARIQQSRADRSYTRPPLHPAVGPTPPPAVLVAPDQPGGGVRPGDDAVVVMPPDPNPQPTLQALLPQQQPGATVTPPQQPTPDCIVTASGDDLPGTGAHSKPLLRVGLMSVGIGAALVFGTLYWRRKTSHGQWFVGSGAGT